MMNTDTTLDSILVQLGEFGKYQSFILSLVSLGVILHSTLHFAFVFSAKQIDYRCRIPECDSQETRDFKPSWLINAAPFYDQTPSKCERYKPFSNNTITCISTEFDRNIIEKCDEFVYKTPEITIQHDFNLHCEENVWKLPFVGSMNVVGQFIGGTISGFLADRYGRRTVFVIGLVLCSIGGIARSFAPSYNWFLFLEFLDAALGMGTYACGFIISVELVGPSKRILSGTLISCSTAFGEIILALLAWWLQNWRKLLLVIYIPPLFIISYLWIIPESVRWLLTQGKIDEAKRILRKAAEVNNRKISEEDFNKLACATETSTGKTKISLINVFKSTPLLLRFINCCFCWITCAFLFYGLTFYSVALAGNSYVDFMLTAFVEIPAYFATYLTVDRWGRRSSQCLWFLMTGVSCLLFMFTNKEWYLLQLTIYLLGKFGATAAFTVIYIITSEMFPTPTRQSVMGACSMFGRIGSMVSPQMPLLGQIWKPLPLLLFGIMSIIGGVLSFFFPETLNTKLPDTIKEAEDIGKSIKKVSKLECE